MSSSGLFSAVFRLTVSPQTPFGSNRLLAQIAKLQLAGLQGSSVHLHQTVLPRNWRVFFPHRNFLHSGKHLLGSGNFSTTWMNKVFYEVACLTVISWIDMGGANKPFSFSLIKMPCESRNYVHHSSSNLTAMRNTLESPEQKPTWPE